MADVTITLGSFPSRTRTLTAAQVQRVLDAYKAHMGNPDATNQEVADFIIDGFFQTIIAVTKQHEHRAAQDAVPEPVLDYGS